VTRPLRLFFLWHFHQPWYADFGGGPTHLPWVRLHALKDYADLPAILSEEPRVPHACNLVPSLLDQIEILSRGGSDAFLDVAKTPVKDWDGDTAAFALNNFFSAHPRMISAFPRYLDLQRRLRATASDRSSVIRRTFSTEDLRDLVVLFHLAWSGATLSRDPLLVRLRKHGHGFSEEEKDALLERQREFLGEVIPAWKRAISTGSIELTTSPYHHPILPLLVDSAAGREAVPDLPLPVRRFSRPEDARDHIGMGLDSFERHFGFRPAGMWPPEGSISAPALALMSEAGVQWAASDEEVLLRSLGRMTCLAFGEGDKARTVFRPYRLIPGPSPVLFFRDRTLSDRIGFSYASWDAGLAAADFVERLQAIRHAAPGEDLVVPVILDGENAWETYRDNGVPFLRALAAALAGADGLEVVKPSDVVATTTPKPLPHLVAGSWVDGNFRTWIGAPAKNRAWDLLVRVREELAAEVAAAPVLSPPDVLRGDASPAAVAKAALFAAEASDWFWWFGDDHSSAHDAVFDALFRGHLVTACRAVGREAPPELEHPIERRAAKPPVLATEPISPQVDGEPADFFEWLGAGRYAARPKGTMERGLGAIREILFGGDASGTSVFLCLHPTVPPASTSLADRRLRVLLAGPDGETRKTHDLPLAPGVSGADGVRLGVGRLVEIALPRPKETAGGPVAFRVLLLDGEGHELESVPDDGWIRFETATSDWSA
jgi:alpha-amylase/alpha-mannosidase (GH57 family)